MEGRVADIALQKNDILFVPTRQELMQEQTLTLHGEVHYPGIYRYAANMTIEDLILQAGGLNDQASTVKVDVARRIRDPKATQTDSIIARTYSATLMESLLAPCPASRRGTACILMRSDSVVRRISRAPLI